MILYLRFLIEMKHSDYAKGKILPRGLRISLGVYLFVYI